jgi:phosphotriesterase-related protein
VAAGAYVEFEHIGVTRFGHDWQRAKNVAELIHRGYLDHILLSTDICGYLALHHYGGKGYDYVLTVFKSMLEKEGVTNEQILTIFVDNPQRAFAY